MKKLADKVAVITGGGQGVGLGIAHALAQDGANLVITGRNEDKLAASAKVLEAYGVAVLPVVADGRKRADAIKAVDATMTRFGRLDILVNNAQSSTPGMLLENIDDEAIAMTLESGLYATIYFMQAAFPHMKQNGGSIINFGSREAIIGGVGFGLYAATKEGVRGVSRVAAREWGRYNIRVNVINPAALSPAALEYFEKNSGARSYYEATIALGYMGDPAKDIGPVAAFLAGPDSRYMTGQTLNVDGGQTML